jgi:hypothetical protein
LPAVHLGHGKIQQYYIGRLVLSQVQSGGTIACDGNFVSVESQDLGRGNGRLSVVFYDQHVEKAGLAIAGGFRHTFHCNYLVVLLSCAETRALQVRSTSTDA